MIPLAVLPLAFIVPGLLWRTKGSPDNPPEPDDGGNGGSPTEPDDLPPLPPGDVPLPDAVPATHRLRAYGERGWDTNRRARRPAREPLRRPARVPHGHCIATA